MRKHIRIFIFSFIILIPGFTFSQQSPVILSSDPPGSDSLTSSSSSPRKTDKRFVPGKISSGMELGTYFTSFSGYGSSFSTYISPYISYPVNSRFRINAGMTIVNSSLFGIKPLYPMNQENSLNGNIISALIYVSGDYLVNERLKISGTLYKEINLFNSVPGRNSFTDQNAQGGYMKVDYKVFENFYIEAGFGYSKGVNPYNPYGGFPYSNGFSYPGSPFIH